MMLMPAYLGTQVLELKVEPSCKEFVKISLSLRLSFCSLRVPSHVLSLLPSGHLKRGRGVAGRASGATEAGDGGVEIEGAGASGEARKAATRRRPENPV